MEDNLSRCFVLINNKKMMTVSENTKSKTVQTFFLCEWTCSSDSKTQLVLDILTW